MNFSDLPIFYISIAILDQFKLEIFQRTYQERKYKIVNDVCLTYKLTLQ